MDKVNIPDPWGDMRREIERLKSVNADLLAALKAAHNDMMRGYVLPSTIDAAYAAIKRAQGECREKVMPKIKIEIEYEIDGEIPYDLDMFDVFVREFPQYLGSEDYDGTDAWGVMVHRVREVEEES